MRLPFIDPSNPTAMAAAKAAEETAGQLGIELVERRVTSVEELRIGLNALKVHEADASSTRTIATLTKSYASREYSTEKSPVGGEIVV
jgi:hypothetical protein